MLDSINRSIVQHILERTHGMQYLLYHAHSGAVRGPGPDWARRTVYMNPEAQKTIIVDKRQNLIDEVSTTLPTEGCMSFCIDETAMASCSYLLCPLKR
jgi:hypothetical protein